MIIEKKQKPFYVSNKDLYPVYVEWHKEILKAASEGKEKPEIPAAIVDAIIKICTKTSYRSEFIGYTFRDDMVGDAIYDCIRFADKFNPEKSTNPFSYITTTAWRAFLRRIDAEKTQSYVKAKIISDTPIHEFFESIDTDDVDLQQNFIDFIHENDTNLSNNEPMSIKRNRKKKLEKLALESEVINQNLELFTDE